MPGGGLAPSSSSFEVWRLQRSPTRTPSNFGQGPAKSTAAAPLRLETSVVLLRSSCAPDAGHSPTNSNELPLRWKLARYDGQGGAAAAAAEMRSTLPSRPAADQ